MSFVLFGKDYNRNFAICKTTQNIERGMEIFMENKTPIYDQHVNLKGKMVDFAGFILPVQYEAGVIKEHLAVRNSCGLFDVSHMGEITCKGPDALKNLNYILTNDFTNMEVGQARYSVMCYPDGGAVDDLIVYKLAEDDYFIVVNASNKDKDYEHILKHAFGQVKFEDVSDLVGQIAIQGKKAKEIMEKLTDNLPEKYYTAITDVDINGIKCMVSQTGYTGEDGYEIYANTSDTAALWDILLKTGGEDIIPCGLGARDTLRLEASMPLYGHELTADINPLQAGLKFAVKMAKEEFIGKKAMEEAVITTKRVGLKVVGKGIVREDAPLFIEDKQVGVTTSGTMVPYLNYPVVMAYVDIDHSQMGTKLIAEVRGRKIEVEIVPMPFYKK